MIAWKLRLWRSAGAAALLGVTACGQPVATTAPSEPPASTLPSGEGGGGEQGEQGVQEAYAGLDGAALAALHLQHLKGFLLLAERVAADAGQAEAGALLRQGLIEAYDASAKDFAGFDPAPVRAAADAASLERIRAGEAAIDTARNRLEANHADLAVRMIDLSSGLYKGVVQGNVVDPTEYRHSLGAALGARDVLLAGRSTLRARNRPAYDEALAAIERYVALYPASAAPGTPAPYRDLLAQSSRVRLALSPFL